MRSDYKTIRQLADESSMSARTVRKYLSEVPHYRLARNGRLLVRKADWERFLETRRIEAQRDADVMDVLRGVAEASR